MKTQFKIWWINYILFPFSWSRWTDIHVFSYGSQSYLLQGKMNKTSNAKKFKITMMKQWGKAADVSIGIDKLEACGLIDKEVKFNTDKP